LLILKKKIFHNYNVESITVLDYESLNRQSNQIEEEKPLLQTRMLIKFTTETDAYRAVRQKHLSFISHDVVRITKLAL